MGSSKIYRASIIYKKDLKPAQMNMEPVVRNSEQEMVTHSRRHSYSDQEKSNIIGVLRSKRDTTPSHSGPQQSEKTNTKSYYGSSQTDHSRPLSTTGSQD
ncbi:hypothetical protein M758_2G024100 [Ceratodon purpureus]|uniref:Uncharacterized protein n=1 Tax=Ceratodon purpureus TaxID=3225 RepID=A0A8T0IPC8_CERPU|nr:hypothetical protein KC19_2G024700 [Ceratodon purpureus]KAG0625051.1 hypothetical protein M758_2G024100 [Ceratodon purpureus]